VVVILAPYLNWSDVTPTSTPVLWSLAERGAVGDVNARSRGRQPGDIASPLEGALTISAGSWAVHALDAPGAYSVDERYEVGTVAEAYRRTTGNEVGDSRIAYLGLPTTARLNADRSFEVVLGTLGETILQQGGKTAAIGNSDVGYVTGEQRSVRPAALAAMDAKGLVALGDVSRRLLQEDPDAPFGLETDAEYFSSMLDEVKQQLDQSGGTGLVVLDAGDQYRATKFAQQVTPEIAARQRTRALKTLDAVVRMAEERFADGVIMVVSQSTGDPALSEPEGIGPIVIAGNGWSGYVTSNSTQRFGLVTNLDVTATVLDVMGLQRPVEVIGNEMRSVPTDLSLQCRIERLTRMDATAVSIDQAKPGIVNTFVAITVLTLAISALILVRARVWPLRSVRVGVGLLKSVLLFTLSVPVSSWLMYLWRPWPDTPAEASIALVVTASAVWAVGMLLWWRTRMRVPVAVLSLSTALVLILDQLAGAPLSFTNFFGYSPLLAARFYGMGNEAAAILFGSTIVGMALLFDEWRGSTAVRNAKLFGIPVVGFVVVFVSAAPFLGANVGVAIWGVAGFGLAWTLMNGRRVTWRLVALALLAVVLLIAILAAIDLSSGGAQTHLARSLISAQEGGLGELWTIVVRKAETNVRVLTRTNWSYILIATLMFLALMRWRPQGDFADTLDDNPHFADAITVVLVGGAVAYVTEDSGIVIPALAVFYVGIGLSWLMLSRALVAARIAHPDDASGTPMADR
jgi:hypothetical protein